MAKIIIDARELRTSSGRYVERLLHYLQQVERGEHEYTVLVTPKDAPGWEPTNPNFTKVITPFKEFTFSEQTGLLRQITNMNANLVHFPFVQQPVWYKGLVVTTMQDLTGIRFRNPAKNWLVFTVKQQIYKWVNKRVARKSRLLITPTEFVKRDVAAYTGVPLSKITVTLEAADKIPDSPTPPKQHNLQNRQFILFVGRPQPHKNLWRLILAFSALQRTYPNLRLVLTGKKDATYKMIEDKVHAAGIKNVLFMGFVSEAELRWLYEHCQAYVFPSLSEGFGLPGLEAMMHGAPVVSSNATCLPEVHGDAALYFNPLSVDDMAAKIDDVLSNSRLRDQLIKKGHAQVKQFSWKRMAEQTLAVYNRALKNK